ncbi:MAG: twin-arginine translocase TatA/TatE family subunit [Verrucomicrobiae bacterium]|nr:twin-arginine translocase TatA/TatE family subunit [Verrucomicrobiae bacterium]
MSAWTMLGWGMPSGGEWIIIFLVVLLLFGAKRLPELARGLGQAKREFQKAAREVEDEMDKAKLDDSSSKPPTSPNSRGPDGTKPIG